jgi:MFS family permease
MLFWLSMYIYVPTLAPYAQELGASVHMVGMIIGSYGFTQMLVRIPIGIICDKTGKKKNFVIIGCAMLFLSGLGLYFAKSPILVLIFRGLCGVAAGTWVAFTVLYSEYFKEDQVANSMGNLLACNSFGNLLGVFFGGVISQHYGQKSTFFVAFIAAGIAFIFSFFVYEERNSIKTSVSVKEIISTGFDKNVLIPSIIVIFLQAIIFSSIFGYTSAVNTYGRMTSFQLGLVSTFFLISKIGGAKLSGGYFEKNYGFGKSISLGFLLIAIMTVLTVRVSSNPILSYFVHAIGGCGYGITITLLMSYVIRGTDKGKKTIAMGFFQSIFGIGMFAGPVISGYFINWWGFTANYLVLTVVGMTCSILSLLFLDSKNIIVISDIEQ